MNLSLAQKQFLYSHTAGGGKVYSIAYDPTKVGLGGGSSDPEADALGLGLSEYLREASSNLVEAIYTN